MGEVCTSVLFILFVLGVGYSIEFKCLESRLRTIVKLHDYVVHYGVYEGVLYVTYSVYLWCHVQGYISMPYNQDLSVLQAQAVGKSPTVFSYLSTRSSDPP